MSESEIAYQNKDIVSKYFADRFKGKSLKVYGIDVPRVVRVLPTNLPDISANELKIDNLFLLEDGSVAIIDYESSYKPSNRNKYINYIARVLKRYERDGVYEIRLRMIVIYTGDVTRGEVTDTYNLGAIRLDVESAFLSDINSDEVKRHLKGKIDAGFPLSEEEIMEFIILPLTYKSTEQKMKAAEEAIEMAKQVKEKETALFLIVGVVVFANKVIDNKVINDARGWLNMTKLRQLIEDEKQEAIREAVNVVTAEKDSVIAEKEGLLAEQKDLLAEKENIIAAMQTRIRELEEIAARKE